MGLPTCFSNAARLASSFTDEPVPNALSFITLGGPTMHVHGKTKLGFFPLPVVEAHRLKNYLAAAGPFSALDPCVGDGVAFNALIDRMPAMRYAIEVDAYRAVQAKAFGIDVLQANTMDVRCPVESMSLLYL